MRSRRWCAKSQQRHGVPLFEMLVRNAWFSILAAVILVGCSVHHAVKPDDVDASEKDIHVTGVELLDGRSLDFHDDPLGYAILRGRTIRRLLESGEIDTMGLQFIRMLHTVRPTTIVEDAMSVVLAVFGLFVFVYLLFREFHFFH